MSYTHGTKKKQKKSNGELESKSSILGRNDNGKRRSSQCWSRTRRGRERLAEAVESISEKEGFELKLRRGMVKEEQPHPHRSRSQEIIFIGKRRKRSIQHPPPLPDICRVSSIKILGVTVSGSLSVCGHVDNVFASCAQSIQAMRILRAHGMAASTIHVIFNAVVVAKLTYAASSWWGSLQRPRIVNDWQRSFVAASALDFAIPGGVWAEPQRKSNFVHFCLKI